MGIKFHCPNGHKLNVKTFLAGKKGVCPKCGTKFRIPGQSEPGLDSDLEGEGAAEVSRKSNGSAAVIPLPVGGGATALATAVAPATVATADSAIAHRPASPALPQPARAPQDPIEEAPTAVWYVRPPTGGQFGPARGDIMRKWLEEGRVSSDSLVWREGWTDWRPAGPVFPSLNPAPPAAVAEAASAPAASLAAARPTMRSAGKQRGDSGVAMLFLGLLAVVCIGLVAALVYVLTNLQ